MTEAPMSLADARREFESAASQRIIETFLMNYFSHDDIYDRIAQELKPFAKPDATEDDLQFQLYTMLDDLLAITDKPFSVAYDPERIVPNQPYFALLVQLAGALVSERMIPARSVPSAKLLQAIEVLHLEYLRQQHIWRSAMQG